MSAKKAFRSVIGIEKCGSCFVSPYLIVLMKFISFHAHKSAASCFEADSTSSTNYTVLDSFSISGDQLLLCDMIRL